jgi:two-component system NarL family sensor kinase
MEYLHTKKETPNHKYYMRPFNRININLKQKIQLLAVLPLAVAMLLVILVTQYQFDKLSLDTATAYKNNVIERRKAELKNYTLLALSSIDHLYNNDDIDTEVAQELARNVLPNLLYKEDGYFFAYTIEGIGVVHPIQPFRIGEKWWDLQD